MTGPSELIIGNARLVLPDRVMENGWLVAAGGRIVDFGSGPPPRGALDFAGDVLAPGLVELHTDHLETHIEPRIQVSFDAGRRRARLRRADGGGRV